MNFWKMEENELFVKNRNAEDGEQELFWNNGTEWLCSKVSK
jgi:hypothetical protein